MQHTASPPRSSYALPLRGLTSFLRAVIDEGNELIAPVKTDAVRFTRITDPRRIDLKEQAYEPVKGHFFRKRETLLSYRGRTTTPVVPRPASRVFFGLRRCDLSAIARQDQVFLKGRHVDPWYQAARAGSILIGYHCKGPLTPWCFCGSMQLEDFYDLMFFRRGNRYVVHVGSEAGASFLARFAAFFTPDGFVPTETDRIVPGTEQLVKKDLTAFFDDPAWEAGADACLSCAACTSLCPTCFCSEHRDEPSLAEPGTGVRTRGWSSCQLPSFTRVAGDHVFRATRLDRFKHRIYHQLQYFRDRHGIDLCTGCGRCITSCPTRIDFLSIINKGLQKPSASRIPLTIVRREKPTPTLSGGGTPELVPAPVTVLDRFEESHDTVTLRLDLQVPHRPGQFFQIGVPGVGEAPISISSCSDAHVDFSIRAVGNVTRALANAAKGDTVSVRGPYGNGYPFEDLRGMDLIVIGGGCGVAPLKGAIDYVEHHRADFGTVHLYLGFRSPKDVIFGHALDRWGGLYALTVTVDAAPAESCYTGTVGFVTEGLKQLTPARPDRTAVLLCGPPAMIKNCSAILHEKGIPPARTYVSAERMMQCAIGTCCHCMIRGTTVCTEGPVFTEEELSRMPHD